MIKKLLYTTLCLLALHGCKIENDIPYPIVTGDITAFEVEGQCDPPADATVGTSINADTRTVTLYVDDTVDLTDLRITKFTVSSDATISVDPNVCTDATKFPTEGFEIPDNLANTCVDFSQPVKFTLHTYQDYVWTVNVTQVIDRTPEVKGMIRHVIDVENRRAYIYVSPEEDLKNITITSLPLGGQSGEVKPDPTTVHDFTTAQEFMVSNGWDPKNFTQWTVRVYKEESSTGTASVFPMTSRATLTGNIVSGKTPVVEYKEASASAWTKLPSSSISVSGTNYTATFSGLKASTAYQCRVTVDGVAGAEQNFTTAPATPLTDGSFDNWSSQAEHNGTLWFPWAEGGTSFWSTGNQGATTIGDSNSKPTNETCNGRGQAALMETKWMVMKLAAGNLFTGDFELDGTHGILTFGREFSAFPSALRIHCKYTTSKIDRTTDKLAYMEGKNDTCHVYFALTTDKVMLRTRNEEEFNPHGSSVIAYGEFQSGENVSGSEQNGYKQVDIPLEYYRTNVIPKYIIIVCSSSKYGNLFTGSTSSRFWLDEMELIYE